MGGHKKQYQKQKSQITTRKCAWGGKRHNGYTCQICCVEIIQVLHKTSEWLDKKKKFTFKGRLGRVWRGLLKCLRVPCLLQLKLTFYANEKLVFCYRIKQPKNTRAPLK